MFYPFYQRITPINALVHVADIAVPDNLMVYHVPVKQQPKFARYEGDKAVYEIPTLAYHRVRSAFGDCFVHTVQADIAPF